MDRQPRRSQGLMETQPCGSGQRRTQKTRTCGPKPQAFSMQGGGGSASLQPPRSLGYPGPKTLHRTPPSWENPGYGPA